MREVDMFYQQKVGLYDFYACAPDEIKDLFLEQRKIQGLKEKENG